MKESVENKTLVSIIIPCRNEEKFIGECLESIAKQDYPKDKMEVLVVDGMSEDKTRTIIENYKLSPCGLPSVSLREMSRRDRDVSKEQRCPKGTKIENLRLLDNPQKFTPFALNLGIKNAKGEIIIRMDAHSTYEKDYVSKCVEYLQEYKADNVGGIWKIMPSEDTLINKSIVFASSSIFGAGNAYYRRGYDKGIKEVDTVFGGCYKREVFDKIGLFNENLIRNQDLEFNLRLRRAGGKIFLAPDIISYYYPKSGFKDFFKHNFQDGFWVTHSLKFKIKAFSWRHLVPLAFVLGLIGTGILGIFFQFFFWLFLSIVGLYLLASFYFSFKIALKEKDPRYFFLMPLAFACRHIAYGLGSIWGILTLGKRR